MSGLGRAEMRGQGLDEVRIDRPMALPGTLPVLFLVVGGAGTEATIAVVGVALVAPAPSGILPLVPSAAGTAAAIAVVGHALHRRILHPGRLVGTSIVAGQGRRRRGRSHRD